MQRSDFSYDLPPELIAQAPLPQRRASRLLVLDGASGATHDRLFAELSQLLAPNDLLVFNDTRVLPARLFGRKASGGAVEVLIERITGAREARVQLRASKKPAAGAHLQLEGGATAEVLGREGEFFRLRFEGDEPLESLLARIGRMPLPPYITREAGAADVARTAR